MGHGTFMCCYASERQKSTGLEREKKPQSPIPTREHNNNVLTIKIE